MSGSNCVNYFWDAILESISKMSFGLPPFSAGLEPRFKSSTTNSLRFKTRPRRDIEPKSYF